MKRTPAIITSLLLLSALGCEKEGLDAFAEEMCACQDASCAASVQKKYHELPELQTKLGEADELPADKRAALEKAMGCSMKLQKSSEASQGSKAAPEAAAKPKLVSHDNAAMGYTIELPEGFETTHEAETGAMYGYDTMIIKVDPSGVALKTPDDLLRAVNTGDGKVDKKTKGDLLLVVVDKPKLPLNIYAGRVGAKMQTHCMAEPGMRELAIEVCSSIRAK
jgi:hypothetical protein